MEKPEVSMVEFYRDGEKFTYDPTITNTTVAGHSIRMTSYYSILDPTWSESYILDVQQAEREVGHSICGAPRPDTGEPCKRHSLVLENEPLPGEIGKCHHHRPSEQATSMVAVDIGLPSNIPDTPVIRQIRESVEMQFLYCGACVFDRKCPRVGENDGRCIIEKEVFDSILSELILENQLDTISDYMMAAMLANTMVKYIRASRHESEYGIEQAVSGGVAKYAVNLKKLFIQEIKTLGLDRKTRMTIRRSSGEMEQFSSIAKALSGVKLKEVELKAAKFTVEKTQEREDSIRHGPAIGLDGEVIEDDIPPI